MSNQRVVVTVYPSGCFFILLLIGGALGLLRAFGVI